MRWRASPEIPPLQECREAAWALRRFPEIADDEFRNLVAQRLSGLNPEEYEAFGGWAELAGATKAQRCWPVLVDQLSVPPPDPFLGLRPNWFAARSACVEALGLVLPSMADTDRAQGVRVEIVNSLLRAMKHPGPFEPPSSRELDASMAAWALGQSIALGKEGDGASWTNKAGATQRAAPRQRVIDALRQVVLSPSSLEWVDETHDVTGSEKRWQNGRLRYVALDALAKIGGDDALLALETAMNRPVAEQRRFPSDLPEAAAAALTRFRADQRIPILAKLLVHGDARVRRQGLLAALRGESDKHRELMELSAPWALPWWDAAHRSPAGASP